MCRSNTQRELPSLCLIAPLRISDHDYQKGIDFQTGSLPQSLNINMPSQVLFFKLCNSSCFLSDLPIASLYYSQIAFNIKEL